MLAERDKLNADIQDVLDKQTEGWGIKVSLVELKRIDLNESMIRVPQAMQLRYLNTLFDIAGDRTSMIVFPFPMELMQGFSAIAQRG
jgi:hypothetical protein